MEERRESNVTVTQCLLPVDITMAVLENLPIKSLVRFLSVSKSFSSNILKFTRPAIPNCDPSSNCLLTINHNPQEQTTGDKPHEHTLKLYLEGESSPYFHDFPYETKESLVISSCNGVLCVKGNTGYSYIIFLWNPSIRKSVIVPYPGNFCCRGLLGFGYDPIRDDYKLVWIDNCEPHPPFIKLYSLRSNTWRSHSETPPSDLHYYSDQPLVYVKGACYWLLYRSDYSSQVIFTFHMENEAFGELPLPQLNRAIDPNPLILVVFKGLVSLVPKYFTSSFPIWVMEEYGNPNCWIKLVNIDLGFLHNSRISSGECQVIGFRGNSEDILIKDYSALVLIKPETQTIQRLNKIFDRNYIGSWGRPCQLYYLGAYRESFGAYDEMSNMRRYLLTRKEEKMERQMPVLYGGVPAGESIISNEKGFHIYFNFRVLVSCNEMVCIFLKWLSSCCSRCCEC